MASQTAAPIPLLSSGSVVAHYASISSPSSSVIKSGLNSTTRFVGQQQSSSASSFSSFSYSTALPVPALSSSTSNGGNTSSGRNISSHCDVVSTSSTAATQTSTAEGNAGGKQQQQQQQQQRVAAATSALPDHQHQRPQSRATTASVVEQSLYNGSSTHSDAAVVVKPTSFTPSKQHLQSVVSSMTASGASATSPATSNNNIGGATNKRTTRHQHSQLQQLQHQEENVAAAVAAGRSPTSVPSFASSSPPLSHHAHRATTTPEPASVMHLRNRPLKAATADDHHHQNGSSALAGRAPTPTQMSAAATSVSTSNGSSGRGRPPGRRRRRSSAVNALNTNDSNGISSPVSVAEELPLEQQHQKGSPSPTHPASRFFPLTTIGSVCEFFCWQMGGSAVEQCSYVTNNSNDSPAEPDLALLSIVLGTVEANLTTLETVMANEENMETNCLQMTSAVTTADHHHQMDQQHQQQNNRLPVNNACRLYGDHSPAEGTPAPSCVNSMGDAAAAAATTASSTHSHSNGGFPMDRTIPAVHWAPIQEMLDKFTAQIKESVDLAKYLGPENENEEAGKTKKTTSSSTRELIKKISDVIWSNLNRSYYKEKPHLQTLYSYLSGGRLDAYGVAYTVVAACQLLGLEDVRLVMSEDHTWVLFADGETCEVTWHGKGNEDRLGEAVPSDSDSWLYLNGQVLVCDRYEAVATAVNAMNPVMNATGKDMTELVLLQRQLLGILYDSGHLRRYPMALGNLGDLEDICRPLGTLLYGRSREPMTFFKEAIESARKYYDDAHVYPYTYMAGYLFRLGRFKDALHWWSMASAVVRRYSYSKEDEEIYNEFKEIANDLVPNIVKHVSARQYEPSNFWQNGGNGVRLPLLQDPDCFAALVRFYDGLCCWEEGASTPVLHIGWTKPLVATINKFDYATRRQVLMKVDFGGASGNGGEVESDYESDLEQGDEMDGEESKHHLSMTIGERRRRRAASENSNGLHHPEDNEQKNVAANTNCRTLSTSSTKRHFKTEPLDGGGDDSAMISSEDENTTTLAATGKKVVVVLSSKKFAGLRSLLTAEKLNTSAIQLQLTAQSQVNVNRRNRSGTTYKAGHPISLGPELDFVSTTTTTLARTGSSGHGGGSIVNNNSSNNSAERTVSFSASSGINGAALGNSNKRLRRE